MTSLDFNERAGLQPVDPHEHYHGLHVETFNRAATSATDEENGMGSPMTNRSSHLLIAAQQAQAIQDLYQKLEKLQKQMQIRPSLTEGVPDTGALPTVTFQPDTDIVLPRDLKADFASQEVIPEIREITWWEFTNKFEDDRHIPAIEILVEKPGAGRDEEETDQIFDASPVEETIPTLGLSTSVEPLAEGKHPVPDRIRINSPYILSTLGRIDKTIDAGLPNVMLGPFKSLVYYELEIRSAVQRLEESKDTIGNRPTTDEALGVGDRGPSSTMNVHADVQTILSHMRCLIEFMDAYVTPTVTRWRTNTNGKIHFRDLWFIFRPGEDIFMPIKERSQRLSFDPTTVQPDRFHGVYQLMWRVTGSGGGRQDLSISHHRGAQRNTYAFKLNCYHLDFDGKYFTPIVHTFSIEPYKGARDVTSLHLFPIRFLEQAVKLQEQTRVQGRLVFDAIVKSSNHFYYVGPTMKRHPCDCPFSADNNNLQQEHIESEVIVDYATALQANPSWAPNLSPWKQPPTQVGEVQDKFRIRYWSDRGRSTLVRTELDHIYDDNTIDREAAMAFKRTESIFNPFPSSWLGNEKSIPEEDTVLLASCVPAFVLRTRTFAPLWLWGLESIKPQNEGLRNLKLQNDSFKNTIHALVRTHFLQKNTRERSESESDTVRGKGKGLIFLLHGAPGVGKTFTAESVAAANGRPLFQITCGDLGLTPMDVEKALNEIFRFAQMWNCVLLLDECDIFLSQRKTDLKRNSLVSVFLRVLEFYTGVLFLTTNRVGALDSAVKSRITWSTYYPPLNLDQTKEIWKVNLDLLSERNSHVRFDKSDVIAFAKKQFKTTFKDGNNWNGRQIQNAFKVALSLAEWDAYSNDEQRSMDTNITRQQENRQVELTSSHFETIASAVEIFERYLQVATGRSEAQRAFDAQERADTFVDINPPPNPNMSYNGTIPDQSSKKRRKSSQSSQIQQKQTGNSNANQQSRSRNSIGQLDIDDAAFNSQTSWMNSTARQSSPQGPLASAATAIVGKQSQFQSYLSTTSPAKKRKVSDAREYYHGRKESSGSKTFHQSETLESSSDSEGTQGEGDNGSDHDTDWD